MRILISLMIFLLGFSVANSNEYRYKVIRVIDGDTVEIEAPFLPVELKQVLKLRIIGVDTPEKGMLAKCELERKNSLSARNFTLQEIGNAKDIKIKLIKWDKYGGRVLGDLILDGQLLSKKLIDMGYAVSYDGGKKSDWCGKG